VAPHLRKPIKRTETQKARKSEHRARRLARQEQERVAAEEARIASLSFSRKLDWASKHIEGLRQLTQAWLGTNAYTLVLQTNAGTGRTVVHARISKPPPPELALMVGDAVHALRATLDHLALELAVAFHRPKTIPAQLEETSEFVIIGVADETRGAHSFDSAAGSKLKGIDPKARDAIKALQPYHRKAAYSEHPLWVIHELDRIDKHRRLSLTAYAMGGVGIGAGPSGFAHIGHLHMERAGHSGPVVDGSVVAIFTALNSQFQMNFTRDLTLAEPSLPNALFVVQTLTTLRDFVRTEVVPTLTPFL
jgi:hypothetical protein